MDLDYEEIGRNLCAHRKNHHLKQAELAEMVDVTAQHISHIECAKTRLSLPLIVRLSEALGISIYDLLGSNTAKRQEAELDRALSRQLAHATVRQKKILLALSRTYLEQDGQENL